MSPELLATMRMLPRLLVIAAVSAAFVLPAASFVRKPEQAVKKSDAGATPLSPTQKLLQPVQLAAAVGLLVELPCYACRRPALGWRLSIEYFAFFAVVTLPKTYRFGGKKYIRARRGAGERRRRRRVRPIPAERLGGPLARGLARRARLDQCSRALRVADCGHGDRCVRRVDAGPGLRPRRDAGVARYDGPVPLRATSHLHGLFVLFAGGLGSLGSPLAVAVLLLSAWRFYKPRMASEDKILESSGTRGGTTPRNAVAALAFLL